VLLVALAIAISTFDVLAGREVFQLGCFILFVTHSVFLLFCLVCFWLEAPNRNRFPPVTSFLGIKSTRRIEDPFEAAAGLPSAFPVGLCFWGTDHYVQE
jgi:hypothetical protein